MIKIKVKHDIEMNQVYMPALSDIAIPLASQIFIDIDIYCIYVLLYIKIKTNFLVA